MSWQRLKFYWDRRDYWKVVVGDAVERFRRWLFPPTGPPFAF